MLLVRFETFCYGLDHGSPAAARRLPLRPLLRRLCIVNHFLNDNNNDKGLNAPAMDTRIIIEIHTTILAYQKRGLFYTIELTLLIYDSKKNGYSDMGFERVEFTQMFNRLISFPLPYVC